MNYQYNGIDSTTWIDLTKWERIPNQTDLVNLQTDLVDLHSDLSDIEDNKFVAKNVFDSSDENIVRNHVINSSENPDKMFTPWTIITDLTAEDLEGLTYDEAVERVENEVNLKLTNRIDLSNLDLNFVNNED